MANFRQAFGGYPQHLDIDLLHPLPADGSIPSGKDVSLFVGRDGEVLVYARPPAPGGTGAFRGIYGLDGAPNGSGSTGLNFFQDGTLQPVSVQPHLATPSDPTGGIDVALADGSGEHWWQDPTDGFIREDNETMPLSGVATIRPRSDLGTCLVAPRALRRQTFLRHSTTALETGRHHLKTSRRLTRIKQQPASRCGS